jgi:hypothetical protein
MKQLTLILVSVLLAAGAAVASADMIPGFAGGGLPLKYFDLQKEMTASDIPVGELQKETIGEVPGGGIPSRQDKRPRSPQSGDPASEIEKQRI